MRHSDTGRRVSSRVFGKDAREREIPVNVFPVSFLVISSIVYETLGLKLFSKRAPDSARSFLQPRALNES